MSKYYEPLSMSALAGAPRFF